MKAILLLLLCLVYSASCQKFTAPIFAVSPLPSYSTLVNTNVDVLFAVQIQNKPHTLALLFNDGPLSSVSSATLLSDSVKFTGVDLADAGQYTLTTTNDVGSTSVSFSLLVGQNCQYTYEEQTCSSKCGPGTGTFSLKVSVLSVPPGVACPTETTKTLPCEAVPCGLCSSYSCDLSRTSVKTNLPITCADRVCSESECCDLLTCASFKCTLTAALSPSPVCPNGICSSDVCCVAPVYPVCTSTFVCPPELPYLQGSFFCTRILWLSLFPFDCHFFLLVGSWYMFVFSNLLGFKLGVACSNLAGCTLGDCCGATPTCPVPSPLNFCPGTTTVDLPAMTRLSPDSRLRAKSCSTTTCSPSDCCEPCTSNVAYQTHNCLSDKHVASCAYSPVTCFACKEGFYGNLDTRTNSYRCTLTCATACPYNKGINALGGAACSINKDIVCATCPAGKVNDGTSLVCIAASSCGAVGEQDWATVCVSDFQTTARPTSTKCAFGKCIAEECCVMKPFCRSRNPLVTNSFDCGNRKRAVDFRDKQCADPAGCTVAECCAPLPPYVPVKFVSSCCPGCTQSGYSPSLSYSAPREDAIEAHFLGAYELGGSGNCKDANTVWKATISVSRTARPIVLGLYSYTGCSGSWVNNNIDAPGEYHVHLGSADVDLRAVVVTGYDCQVTRIFDHNNVEITDKMTIDYHVYSAKTPFGPTTGPNPWAKCFNPLLSTTTTYNMGAYSSAPASFRQYMLNKYNATFTTFGGCYRQYSWGVHDEAQYCVPPAQCEFGCKNTLSIASGNCYCPEGKFLDIIGMAFGLDL